MASMDAQWLKTQFETQPNKTKAGLAQALGLEAPAVSKILSGTRQIKAGEYLIMRAFFGLPVDGERAARNDNAYVLEPLGAKGRMSDSADNAQADWILPAEIMQKRTRSTPDHIKSFRVEDNMMSPDFKRDEHVLVDLEDRTPTPPGTFVVSDGFGYLLRNIEHVPSSNPAQIRISALDKNFQSQILNAKDFNIVGRVIAKLQWL